MDHLNTMRQLVREFDWARTPLGPMRAWPNSLRSAVEILLDQPAPMIILWGEKLLQIYNDGYRPILAKKHPRALGQPTHQCWSEITEITKPLYAKVLAGSPLSLEDLPLHLDRGDGLEQAFITVTYSPLKNDLGAIAGILAVVQETTARKQAEAQLADLLQSETRARHEAECANRTKDDFVATLSHELRTPLNAIIGWSQILARTSGDNPELAEGLATIERNALAQSRIIEDLLDMNRIASGKIRLDLQHVDLRTVISAALDSIRPAAKNKHVHLSSSISAPNPAVIADPARLLQILANLLTNAIKFTPGGGTVDVRLTHSGNLLQLSVTDSGIGIPPDLLPFVFDRFRQADSSASRKHGGLGLGLAIVKQLAELHGGSISVSSDGHGKGAAFTLSLPAAHHDTHIEIGQPPSSPAGELAGVRVLVVDDEPDARTVTRRILESAAASVTTAGSVEDALWQLRSHPFDILVSDIGMPGEDGYSLIRRLRDSASAPNLPAVALTAFARPEDRIKALEAGFHLHAVKPIDPAELVTIVASLTNSRSI